MTGYKDYRCMCGAIPECKLGNILKAPTDFHVGTNESKYTCNVCDLPLHAICYEEGNDNRCFKCNNDIR